MMTKERITCREYCNKWNSIDRDCEIYGHQHPCPRNCPEFFDYVFEENKKLRKQLEIAVEALELAKGFYGYCRMKGYTVALSHDFNDDYEKINNALAEIQELNK